jgi:hypothetical protein
VLLVAAAVSAAVVWVLAFVYGPGLIESAYAGHATPLLNGLITGQKRYAVTYYTEAFERTLLGLAVGAVALSLVVRLLWSEGLLRLSRTAILIGLVVLGGTIAVGRLATFDEPIERDEAAYMVIADGLLRGRTMYDDLWDHKPPAVHGTYAIAAALAGPTPLAFWLMSVASATLTLVGCYKAGRALGGPMTGLLASAAWALFSGDLLLQANQPNVEVFMNVCLVWAFVTVLRLGPEAGSLGLSVGIGLLYFLATLYKPVAVAPAFCVVGVAVLWTALTAPLERRARSITRSVLTGGIAAAVAVTGWIAVFGYFWGTGRLSAFREAFIDYNRDYAGSISDNVLSSVIPSVDALWPLLPYAMLLAATAVVSFAQMRGERHRQGLILLAYLAGAWLAVVMPGRLYPHYFQLMLPPAALGAGWMISSVLERRSLRGLAVASLALWPPCAARAYQAMVPFADVPVFKYGGYGYDIGETQRMGSWIQARLSPQSVLFHWGADPSVYLYAHRPSPVGFVFNLPLKDSSDRARRYTEREITELEKRHPDLIVAHRNEMKAVDHPVDVWIDRYYTPVTGPPGVERYLFLVPRHSDTTPANSRS